jgi:hypothetical protein
MRNADCGLRNGEDEMGNAERGMRNGEDEMGNAERGLRNGSPKWLVACFGRYWATPGRDCHLREIFMDCQISIRIPHFTLSIPHSAFRVPHFLFIPPHRSARALRNGSAGAPVSGRTIFRYQENSLIRRSDCPPPHTRQDPPSCR